MPIEDVGAAPEDSQQQHEQNATFEDAIIP